MASKRATVRTTEQGRITIPKEVREALDIDGEEALIDIEVSTNE